VFIDFVGNLLKDGDLKDCIAFIELFVLTIDGIGLAKLLLKDIGFAAFA
jgi:hypothetical protein